MVSSLGGFQACLRLSVAKEAPELQQHIIKSLVKNWRYLVRSSSYRDHDELST